LIDTHNKLVNGCPIEPHIVNILLLSGIQNILSQNEELDDALKRVKGLEIENTETKLRIESIETWLLKLNDKVEDVSCKTDSHENEKASEHPKNDLEDLRKEFDAFNKTIVDNATSEPISDKKSCTECGKTFLRNHELEKHMVNTHGAEKPNKCETCGKTFYLKWRLEKHVSIHEGSPKPCKYFEMGNPCPFFEVGCMFQHKEAEIENDELEVEEEQNEKHEELEDNFCNFCDLLFANQGELIAHMGYAHLDQFPHIQQQPHSLIIF
jgi:uncharacterized C2H2 Zn-finger protein